MRAMHMVWFQDARCIEADLYELALGFAASSRSCMGGDDSYEVDVVISLLSSLNEPYQKEDNRGMAGLYTIWNRVNRAE